jgi:hypothetical protein
MNPSLETIYSRVEELCRCKILRCDENDYQASLFYSWYYTLHDTIPGGEGKVVIMSSDYVDEECFYRQCCLSTQIGRVRSGPRASMQLILKYK